MHVEIDPQPARRLATVRHLGPYNQIGRAFADLGRRLGPAMGGLAMHGAAMIALYYDAPESVAPSCAPMRASSCQRISSCRPA